MLTTQEILFLVKFLKKEDFPALIKVILQILLCLIITAVLRLLLFLERFNLLPLVVLNGVIGLLLL